MIHQYHNAIGFGKSVLRSLIPLELLAAKISGTSKYTTKVTSGVEFDLDSPYWSRTNPQMLYS